MKHFQRQNELPQDGIVGDTTWNELMADDAKHYAVSKEPRGMISRRSSSDYTNWAIWLLQTR